MTKKLSTRGQEVAVAIAAAETFQTHGALRGERVAGLTAWDSGRLSGNDLDRFREDAQFITYVVYSYATPIAWTTTRRGWHRVAQKFSRTTSQHQGRLYLIP